MSRSVRERERERERERKREREREREREKLMGNFRSIGRLVREKERTLNSELYLSLIHI